MKKLKLNNSSSLVLVDDRDFKELSQFSWSLDAYGYPCTKGKQIQLVIMGKRDGFQVDHKNQNKLDNRRQNLRYATHTENQLNTPSRGGISVHKGLTVDKRRLITSQWRVKFSVTPKDSASLVLDPKDRRRKWFELCGIEKESYAAIIYNIYATYNYRQFGARVEFLELNRVSKRELNAFKRNGQKYVKVLKSKGVPQRLINKFLG